MGHFFHQHPIPIVKNQKYHPYSGCYALSKVLEEVMLEQYYTQYNLNAPLCKQTRDFLLENGWEVYAEKFCNNGPDADWCFINTNHKDNKVSINKNF